MFRSDENSQLAPLALEPASDSTQCEPSAAVRGNRLLLFPVPDWKFDAWAEAIEAMSEDHEAVSMERPAIGFKHILRYRQSGYKIDAYVIRYLNDRGSLLGSIKGLVGETLSILTARVFRIPVIWIIHNIDRETCNQRQFIIRLRRAVVRWNASAFFVTEDVLVEHARRHHRLRGPVGVVPLGPPNDFRLHRKQPRWKEFQERAEGWLERMEAREGPAPCLLVVGTPYNKYPHFWRLAELLETASRKAIPLRVLVVGPLDKGFGGDLIRMLEPFEATGQVFLSHTHIPLDWIWAAEHCTALLRGYSDLSMSHAIYHAVCVKMPVLALPGGIVPEVVRGEGIGEVLDDDLGNLGEALACLQPLNEETVESFLATRSLKRAAHSLLSACKSS